MEWHLVTKSWSLHPTERKGQFSPWKDDRWIIQWLDESSVREHKKTCMYKISHLKKMSIEFDTRVSC